MSTPLPQNSAKCRIFRTWPYKIRFFVLRKFDTATKTSSSPLQARTPLCWPLTLAYGAIHSVPCFDAACQIWKQRFSLSKSRWNVTNARHAIYFFLLRTPSLSVSRMDRPVPLTSHASRSSTIICFFPSGSTSGSKNIPLFRCYLLASAHL